MKTHKKLFSLLLALCLLLSLSITALAASYTGDAVVPGLSGIQPGDELTHPDNTDWATLTAGWGVRVTFVDWDESELKSEVVPVTDNTPGSSSAPASPTRSGYTFTGWERHDTNNGTAALNGDGTVTGVNGPGPIVFIAKYTRNTKPTPPPDPKVGNLTVSKRISGNAADKTKAFSFTVTLGDTSINGTYGDMSFVNGVAAFFLKGGESKTATGLPAGTSYTVSEVDYSADGYATIKSGDMGTIADGKTATAVSTSTKGTTTPPKSGSAPGSQNGNLTVSKTISGNAADSSKAFNFTVTLSDISINGTYGDMSFINGVAAFTLKGGESKTATGLPAGTGYTVSEADYSADGYVTIKSGDTGTITGGKTAAAEFTNTKDTAAPAPVPTPEPADPATPKTGDNSNFALWIMLLAASVAGMTGTIIYSRKRKRN